MKRFLSIIISFTLVFLSLQISVNGSSEHSLEFEVEVKDPLNIPRYNHTSTLIQDDMDDLGPSRSLVYVAGGTSDGVSSISSCEVYIDGQWEEISSMNEPRMRHGAIASNNELIVTGGFSGRGHPSLFKHFNGEGNHSLSSCEIYDRENDSWDYLPSMSTGRFWHGTLKLRDGRIIVIGGLNTTIGALSSCEVYDRGDDQWKTFPSLPVPLARFAYGVTGSGNIIVAGGHDGLSKSASGRVFILKNEQSIWREVTSMKYPRGYPGFCFSNNGKFIVSGGFSDPGEPDRSDSEMYDPIENRWEFHSDLQFPRHGHGSVTMDNGGILIVGGSNCQTGGCHSNLEFLEEGTSHFEDTGHLITARKWGTATMTLDGRVIIAGGKACNYATSNTEEFTALEIEHKEEEVDVLLLIIIGCSIPFLVSAAVLIYSKRRL
jgi:hypothetical protein